MVEFPNFDIRDVLPDEIVEVLTVEKSSDVEIKEQ